MVTQIPSWIYQQFDADYTLEYPAEGFGGWKKIDLPYNLGRCAVAVMHAWELQSYEEVPGHWRCVEYIPRAEVICKDLLPPFLDKVRESGIRIIHIGSSGQDITHYPGYKAVLELGGALTMKHSKVERCETLEEFHRLKQVHGMTGAHNRFDIAKGRVMGFGFNMHVQPQGDELVATTSDQVYNICKNYGINHIIYTGFAINMCLMMVTGGWMSMRQHGVTCSVIRELVTGVENKESVRGEKNKEYGLWHLSICSGAVLEQRDFFNAISSSVNQ
jgi:hypothetical protein